MLQFSSIMIEGRRKPDGYQTRLFFSKNSLKFDNVLVKHGMVHRLKSQKKYFFPNNQKVNMQNQKLYSILNRDLY